MWIDWVSADTAQPSDQWTRAPAATRCAIEHSDNHSARLQFLSGTLVPGPEAFPRRRSPLHGAGAFERTVTAGEITLASARTCKAGGLGP